MIGVVENAMLARLAAASAAGAIGYSYRTLETWPAKFDQYLEARQVNFPAAWTAFAGAHQIDRIAKGRWRAHCGFAMVVAAENLRNEQSRRQGGSPSEPGSYQLAIDALSVLADQTLGLDIDALKGASIAHVETSDIPKLRQISIYAVNFETALYYDTAPVVSGIADFVTFHADWDPAPYGHLDPANLPDDAHAIAGADNVTLPGPFPA